jgi:hypothetical protein
VCIADVLVKNGVTHVGRYLPTTDWKGLSLVEVEVIKEAGLNLISIYEKGSTKASYFTKDQGIEDANHAEQLAKSLNQPEGQRFISRLIMMHKPKILRVSSITFKG